MKNPIRAFLLLAVAFGVLTLPPHAMAEDTSAPNVTDAELDAWLTLLQAPHLPGDPGHLDLIDHIRAKVEEIHPKEGKITTESPDQAFESRHWVSASIVDSETNKAWHSNDPCEGPIWELPHAGLTGPNGVSGELIFAGTTRGFIRKSIKSKKYSGKFVVVEVEPFSAKFPLAIATKNAISASSYYSPGSYKRALALDVQVPLLKEAKKAGALGLIVIADGAPEIVNHQYVPFTNVLEDVPAVYVDRTIGPTLIERAKQGKSVTLRIEGTVKLDSSAPTLIVTLPATHNCKIDEQVIVIDTHTDGPNMFEENGVIALWALLKAFSQDPCRPRDLVFVFAAAHFSKERGSTDNFLAGKMGQALIPRTRAALAIEHLGALRSNADGPGVGETEPALVMVSAHDKALSRIAEEVMTSHAKTEPSLTPIHFLWSLAFQFGEGNLLKEKGVPTIGYLTNPSYLLSRECGHETWFSRSLMRKQIDMFRDLVKKMMTLPRR